MITWLAEWVLKNQPEANLVASDPRFSNFFADEPNPDRLLLYSREEATRAILETVAEENKHIISQHDAACAIGRECIGKAGQQTRIIHLLSSGRGIDNAKDAVEMAKAVDAELGEEMMALYESRIQKLLQQRTSSGPWTERVADRTTGKCLGS